ncbi:ATP-grasp fold amidoligase family protein [Paraburkholderia sp. HP33-1]|uniref:ATP-grasp fold amidoligase family protein n=1 Tax=Paraburkholderia sp. HP33-1 TaxID=2883243 RepID=UPI001F2BA6C7|nr:ATP-grasp fold amidoligase family protein [Paraburkholderia sp. HP33-1]
MSIFKSAGRDVKDATIASESQASLQTDDTAVASLVERPARHTGAHSSAPQSPTTGRKIKEAAKTLLPDALFLSLLHHKCIGRYPHLIRPVTFNEKILQRNLHPDPRYVCLSDKLLVRDYIARKIGDKHLIPLIAAPDAFTPEVFDALPDAFVMKANHGSSFVELVTNKSETSFEKLKKLADQWLHTDFYCVGRERHYEMIEPRIFFEQLLLDQRGQIPADFKLHCFNGRPGRPIIYILVISDRFGNATHGDVYDIEWNHLDIAIGDYKRSAAPAPRPRHLQAVLDVAARLCEDFDYVRVDLYAPDNLVYFGELTFTPGAGVLPFTPDSVDFEWGKLMV